MLEGLEVTLNDIGRDNPNGLDGVIGDVFCGGRFVCRLFG